MENNYWDGKKKEESVKKPMKNSHQIKENLERRHLERYCCLSSHSWSWWWWWWWWCSQSCCISCLLVSSPNSHSTIFIVELINPNSIKALRNIRKNCLYQTVNVMSKGIKKEGRTSEKTQKSRQMTREKQSKKIKKRQHSQSNQRKQSLNQQYHKENKFNQEETKTMQ